MAKINSPLSFLGTVGNLTAYKLPGIESTILRSGGGPSSEKVKNDPVFVNTRRNNKEFGGRSTTAKRIKDMMRPIQLLADHNIIYSLNTLVKPIQIMDTAGEWGRRSIKLSAHPRLLVGFSLNEKNLFDSAVRNTVNSQLDRSQLKAVVDIPALLPGINFFVPWSYPLYSFQLALGVVPDMVYNSAKQKYDAPAGYDHFLPQVNETGWFPVQGGSPAISLELNYPSTPPDQSFILLLSIGIRYGMPGASGQIEQIPKAGAGRILGAE